jgi:hypothetical protein
VGWGHVPVFALVARRVYLVAYFDDETYRRPILILLNKVNLGTGRRERSSMGKEENYGGSTERGRKISRVCWGRPMNVDFPHGCAKMRV